MEPCLYDDTHVAERFAALEPVMEDVRKQKRRLTLDLSGRSADSKSSRPRSLLTSPDVRMLKLASPELERLILQQSGLVTATPTPGGPQALHSVLARGDEHESYTRGFLDAMHDMRQPSGPPQLQQYSRPFTDPLDSMAFYTTLQNAVVAAAGGSPRGTVLPALPPPPPLASIKHEHDQLPPPSTVIAAAGAPVPDLHPFSLPPPDELEGHGRTSRSNTRRGTPILLPSNVEHQDQMKLERKRLRNRIAATKCRNRKLERITQLEKQVDRIRGDNMELQTLAGKLRQQVDDLKREVMEHSRRGCHITVPASVLADTHGSTQPH